MAKVSGLGDGLLVAGYDLSGDVGSIGSVSTPIATLDVTGINKSAYERILGLRDGNIQFNSFFNTAASQEHAVLKTLPRTDIHVTYLRGTTIGNAAASMVAKQLNYDGTRGTDGSMTFAIEAQANSFGLDWGKQLTAGLRTDTTATNGASIDTTASASFGAVVYLQVTGFSGTDCTVSIQDSANDSAFTTVTDLTFTATTAANTYQRIFTSSSTATVRRYLRAITTTSAGFTSISFNVVINKHNVATVTP